jgi:hypothetical protein
LARAGAWGDNPGRAEPVKRLAAVVAVLLALAAFVAAGTGRAHDPKVTLSVTDAPASVTAGLNVLYTSTFVNLGEATLTRTTLRHSLSAGTILLITTSQGTCTNTATTATCNLGQVGPGSSITVDVVVTAPTSPGSMTDTVVAQFREMTTTNSNLVTVKDVEQTIVKPLSQDGVSGFAIAAGATLTTGLSTSPGNPHGTAATVPPTVRGTTVELLDLPASSPTQACGAGFSCFGQISSVTIPITVSARTPFRFVVHFDSTEIPNGKNANNLKIFKDGVLVRSCAVGTSTAALPCIESVKGFSDEDLEAVMLSTTNGFIRGG